MTTAYIVFGHGSRAQEAKEDLEATTKSVQEKLKSDKVYPAYMELNKPSLEDVVDQIATEEGVTKIVVIPFFLFRGIHLQQDIPAKIKKLREQFDGQFEIKLANHLGADERIADILVDRASEV